MRWSMAGLEFAMRVAGIFDAARKLRGFYGANAAAFAAAFLLLVTPASQAADQGYLVLQQPALQLRNPSAVLLISITHAGSRLVAVGEHGVVIYSDDNGASWHQAAVPVEVTITSVAFATDKDGWAAGAYGVILHSTDGGASWKLQITGEQVNQLMLQAAAQASQSNPQDPQAARAVRRASIFAAAGPDKPFLTILALSPTQAIVLGGYRMCVRTANAGASWADCSLNVQDAISHNVYGAILAGNMIYAVGEVGDMFSADMNGDVFKALNSPSTTTLLDILQTKNGTLLAYGVADSMFRSTDGGNSWTSIAVPGGADLTGGAVTRSGMVVVTSENGVAFASKDDGQTFQQLPLTLGMAVFGVAEAANRDLVFVGSAGIRVASQQGISNGL